MVQMTESNVTDEQPLGSAPEPGRAPVEEPGAHDLPIIPVREQITDLGKTVGNVRCDDPYVVAENVDVFYGDNHAIKDVTLEISKKEVIALIGPSGCGK